MSDTATLSTADWKLPSHRKVGLISLILTESALFTIFVVAYVFYMGKSSNPPYPAQVLKFPLTATIALLSSSATILCAEMALRRGSKVVFQIWWALTIALGVYFLCFTAMEWRELIFEKNLALQTNVFGTTFYSLVGLHAFHVIVGVFLLLVALILSLLGKVSSFHSEHLEMISWYWHFVDAIWIVVVTLVYIISTRVPYV